MGPLDQPWEVYSDYTLSGQREVGPDRVRVYDLHAETDDADARVKTCNGQCLSASRHWTVKAAISYTNKWLHHHRAGTCMLN